MSNHFESDDSKGFFCYHHFMKIKTIFTALYFLSIVGTTACTSNFVVRNQAVVLSAEKFDNEVIALSKENYTEAEQQKMFADFIKKNSRVEIDKIEVNGNDATAELTIRTPSRALYPELKTLPGKEWATKVDTSMENRRYSLTLKKTGDSWGIVDQKELSITKI
jgi:hypothetical protein